MENTEIKSCPVKSFFCSKNVLIVLSCLACFFIGYYAGSKTAKVPQARLVRPAGSLSAVQFNARLTQPKINVNTPKLPKRPVINPNIKPIDVKNTKNSVAPATVQPKASAIKAQQLAKASQSKASKAIKKTSSKK